MDDGPLPIAIHLFIYLFIRCLLTLFCICITTVSLLPYVPVRVANPNNLSIADTTRVRVTRKKLRHSESQLWQVDGSHLAVPLFEPDEAGYKHAETSLIRLD
jgi:hypothetical protein